MDYLNFDSHKLKNHKLERLYTYTYIYIYIYIYTYKRYSLLLGNLLFFIFYEAISISPTQYIILELVELDLSFSNVETNWGSSIVG